MLHTAQLGIPAGVVMRSAKKRCSCDASYVLCYYIIVVIAIYDADTPHNFSLVLVLGFPPFSIRLYVAGHMMSTNTLSAGLYIGLYISCQA